MRLERGRGPRAFLATAGSVRRDGIAALVAERGYPATAEVLGCSIRAVRANVPAGQVHLPRTVKGKKARAAELYAKGHSVRTTAALLHTTRRTVQAGLAEAGIPIRFTTTKKNQPKETEDA
jgi:hypothetical protein